MITSNEPAPTTSSAQQPAGHGGFGAQIRSFLQSNLAAVTGAFWSAFLFVGGLIFLVYFASIGFMPEVDLQTSIALLVVSALTGGFLLLVLGVYFLAPGWWWVQLTRHQEPLRSPGWFFWPMLGVILSTVLIPRWWCVIPLFIVSGVTPLVLLLSGGKLLDKLTRILDKLAGKLSSKQGLGTVGAFYLGFLPNVVFVLLILWIVSVLIGQSQDLRGNAMLDALYATIVILACNTAIVIVKSVTIVRYLLLVAVIFFLLFIPLNIGTFIPKRVMSIFKFGNIQNASLVLNEIGCTIVKLHGLTVTPYTPDPKPDSLNPKTCALPNVMIHSQLGNTYYLEVSRSGDASMHFTIPGQNVLSWAVNESKKATVAGSPASTQNPAPTTKIAPPNKGMEPTR